MQTEKIAYDFQYFDSGTRIIEVNAVSVTGSRLSQEHAQNQDSFITKVTPKATYIVTADGLGSCNHAAIGSKLAVDCVQDWMEQNFEKYEHGSSEMIKVFHSQIIDRWRKKILPSDYREFDSTLLYVIVTDSYIWIGGIGDGMILCKLGAEIKEYSWAKDEFSNRTLSLATPGASELMWGNLIQYDDSNLPLTIIVATDGIAEDLDPASKLNLPEYLHQELMKSDIIDLQIAIEEWVIHWKTRNHTDDRTFCMMNIHTKRE